MLLSSCVVLSVPFLVAAINLTFRFLCQAGCMVVIHGLNQHYSAPNLSSKSRCAYILHAYEGPAKSWASENWSEHPFPPFNTSSSNLPHSVIQQFPSGMVQEGERGLFAQWRHDYIEGTLLFLQAPHKGCSEGCFTVVLWRKACNVVVHEGSLICSLQCFPALNNLS